MLSIPLRELDALRKLRDSGVQYLIVGGHAVRHYGVERTTEDLDVFVSRAPENALRLYAAIVNILGRLPDFDWAVLAEPNKHINFGSGEPNLDVLTAMPGLEFNRAYADRTMAVQDGLSIPVLAKADLIATKKEVASRDARRRERELKDIELLAAGTA